MSFHNLHRPRNTPDDPTEINLFVVYVSSSYFIGMRLAWFLFAGNRFLIFNSLLPACYIFGLNNGTNYVFC